MEPIQIAALAVVALAVVIYRQLQTRPTAGSGVLYTSAAMIVGGVVAGGLIDTRHLALSAALLLAEAVAAVGLGMWRASTVRVWVDSSGVALSKATLWTLLVWLASVAVRIGLYAAGQSLGLSLSTGGVLVYVGLTLGAQAYLIARRGRALTGTEQRADSFLR
ncbi:hypothetical protein [Nonomuraea zeae]|uniref:DUF1453 domain-containing protein n=1 Tax=Nonomuraea zeae TaxID=1642303 RepID=A0A5S4G478_9ACTN|nr:hypothetical protein [Nonomuraea zeae]TMR27324.1 hypothetical protein ETD85_39405 [Nonomuraea zeae]